ncbi:MAG: NAD(P)/FAD-dependent oxidoreductase [bacterium]|nr:NAD(P)/FAD-dependent oxidoreductase [bacterium]
MIDNYEVIIVGAGVSGLMLAKLLDDSNLQVLLLEKKPNIQIEPRTFGTFAATAKEHGLEKYIDAYFDTFAFYGPTAKAVGTETDVMCLVDYQKWAQEQEFRHVTIRTGIDLQEAYRTEEGIVLRDHNKSYFGNLIVDSSGYAQVVSKLLGLQTLEETGLSFEVELENCEFPIEKEASFILNTDVANSGGWLYILPNGKGQYGWADFYPESESDLEDLKHRTLAAMKSVAPHNKWLKNADITYAYGRFGPTGKVQHKVYDNFITIGDAGGFGTPVTLEGFRESLDSARFAFLTITKSNTYSKNELIMFSDLFQAKHGKYYGMHKLVKFLYLRWARNQDIDRWINNFKKLDKENFFRLIKGELTASLMLRTLDVFLVKDLLLNAINNLLPAFLQFRDSISLSKK